MPNLVKKQIYVTEELWDRAAGTARLEGKGISALVRELLEQWLEKYTKV